MNYALSLSRTAAKDLTCQMNPAPSSLPGPAHCLQLHLKGQLSLKGREGPPLLP